MHLLSRTRTADVDAPLLQELRLLQASASGGARPSADEPLAAALPPPPPPLSPAKAASDKEFVRRMPYHVVPPYVEVNYKLMTFIMTRAPRIEDFPHERYAAFSPRSPKSCGDSLSLSLSSPLSCTRAFFFAMACARVGARAAHLDPAWHVRRLARCAGCTRKKRSTYSSATTTRTGELEWCIKKRGRALRRAHCTVSSKYWLWIK